MLNSQGFGTLLLDVLPQGERNSNHRRFELNLFSQRVACATEWLVEQPETESARIAYFGTSMGAAAALEAAATLGRQIGAIVAAGGRPDLAHRSLSKVSSPTLLIVGSRDHLILELNKEALR